MQDLPRGELLLQLGRQSDRVRVSRERLTIGDVEDLGELPVIVLAAGSTESPLSAAAMRSESQRVDRAMPYGLGGASADAADWCLV